MITLISPVKRRPGLSHAEFHTHWRDVHAGLIRNTPKIARHLTSYIQYPARKPDYDNGEPPWDGVAIARYKTMSDMQALFAEHDYQQRLRPDEEYLTLPEEVQWILCDTPNIVIE